MSSSRLEFHLRVPGWAFDSRYLRTDEKVAVQAGSESARLSKCAAGTPPVMMTPRRAIETVTTATVDRVQGVEPSVFRAGTAATIVGIGAGVAVYKLLRS